ncbi:hypothetical protein G7Z17_g7494 [Cylindrodendrum hubeiense]|uniref:Uncharacterized protein n=1 Tax=Cylindrodendrum hubeiense TaxID=595255 RepID=A0A9P5H5F0_9HYPO|nr:hypothetical protein G7Z17_g7494 [Cylindrodendrum hubeiense]
MRHVTHRNLVYRLSDQLSSPHPAPPLARLPRANAVPFIAGLIKDSGQVEVLLPVKTSSPRLPPAAPPPAAPAQDGTGASRSRPSSPASPALSTASTVDGEEEIESSPVLPPLPAPRLPDRALQLLRTPPASSANDNRFGTASWGSPYPESDSNLRRQSFSSEPSDDSPIHQLGIETPFLRPVPVPQLLRSQTEPQSSVSAAAAVLANRVRRQTLGLTEDWIRTHTTDDLHNSESRHWFSDGSGSEHSSLSGSELGWQEERDLTPRATEKANKASRQGSPHTPRARSSIETLKPGDTLSPKTGQNSSMATSEVAPATHDAASDRSQVVSMQEQPVPESPMKATPVLNGEPKLPATPTKATQKPLPKEPSLAMTPRIKRKVPWKGKNIMVLIPRDDERGMPGKAPVPLRQNEINRMFTSWQELGYDISGFDLEVEGYQPPGTDDSQTRDSWPNFDQVDKERAERVYKVTLPDLNAWKEYENELQEAKLRALGVSFGDDEPPPPSISPATDLSRQPSVQYPPLPFSPPLPTSSASSSHGMPGFPHPGQFAPGRSSHGPSPSLSIGTSPVHFSHGKFNPRQSISLPASTSPFGMQPPQQGWQNQAGILHGGMNRHDSPSMMNFNGMMSPQSPFGPESPGGFPMHQRHQSLQFPMLPHQQQFQYLQPARASPRLQEVLEDEEEPLPTIPSKSPSKTPEPPKQNPDGLQAEIDDAEYHLEEQLREQMEHEDYNPQPQTQVPVPTAEPFVPAHERQVSEHFPAPELFAKEPSKPLVLHHPRPHSRGHSLSQPFYRDKIEAQETTEDGNLQKFRSLNEIPETQKADEAYEIETNPSNSGTPAQMFEFADTAFAHKKNFSTASNPWNDSVSVNSSAARRSSHGSKASLSKLNVQAPEFKFNPGQSTFTPGQFNFNNTSFPPAAFDAPPFQPAPFQAAPFQAASFQAAPFQAASFQPAAFQPAVFQAGISNPAASPPALTPSFSTPAKINATAPSFSPGQSDFSFSASGPKFNPVAPAFTPQSDSFASPTSGTESVGKRGSIFGSIDLTTSAVFQPGKKFSTKGVPIVSPPSESGQSLRDDDEPELDTDGRPLIDESRIKRAKSSAPDGDDVPLFAEQPVDAHIPTPEPEVEEEPLKDEPSATEADNLPIDTSMSSIVTSDQLDTKATTATPSETSPTDLNTNRWQPFEFKSSIDFQNFNDARPFGEDNFKHGHKKTLSAAAQPFVPGLPSYGEASQTDKDDEVSDLSPIVSPVPARSNSGFGASRFSSGQSQPRTVSQGLSASRFASPPPKPKGLAASRFAKSPTPEQEPYHTEPVEDNVIESVEHEFEPEAVEAANGDKCEPTFEEIDAVMNQFYDDPSMGVNKVVEAAKWQHDSPTRNLVAAVANSSPYRLEPAAEQFTRDEASATPREYHALPIPAAQPMLSTELEDPFVDPPSLARTPENAAAMEGESQPASDWDGAFTEDEHDKLENRAQFFDGRVNEVVGTLLAARLEPLEKTLFSIQQVLATRARRTPSSRRDMRSVSAEFPQSDADDEDEEPVLRRSMSPRRDRRLDHIRIAVMEGLNAQQRNQAAVSPAPEAASAAILEALDDMKKSLGSNVQLGDDLKRVIEQAVESRMPAVPNPDEAHNAKIEEMQAKMQDLEHRLYFEQTKVENELVERRAAEDMAAEMYRKLQAAETRVEIEIINRSVFDQRVHDLEERVRQHEHLSEESVNARRVAEDRLTEVRCHHEAAAEEVARLRETVDQKEHKLRSVEQSNSKTAMRMALLEAAQGNSAQSLTEMTNKCSAIDVELRDVRQDNHHWRAEFERADESARQKASELSRALEENQHMQRSLTTLTTQLEENDRMREAWRGKFISLQEDMGKAAREIAEDNARRIKKDQAMLARQDVLDARLQAEAKTRERLEIEMERLQDNERSAFRAVNECKRLESLMDEMKNENHRLEQSSMRYQREFEEARESGLSEVKRTRMALQLEVDSANNQVNFIREELEEQNSKLRSELDNVRLEADTANAQNEMLLEEAQTTKSSQIDELHHKHQNEIEDLQTRYERQVNNTQEDAHKAEKHLLERLSLSASKTEHLQDRILHLEDKLEIAKQAAAAAAQAAKSAGVDAGSAAIVGHPKSAASRTLEAPEKISPQALRESIMVLQEQLQAREQRIEELEHVVSKADPDAPTKITKRDDEISWLRELLAVRHENLQDIITALSGDRYNPDAVKDAAIRLKANLQMEEQERERAMNGGSSINLPNIAQSIQAATPRVAQAVGPIAAAWGNWRKGNQSSFSGLSGVLSSPATGRNATPSRSSPAPQNSLLGGLLTPPASGLRQTPPVDNGRPQPTAFASTGRRYPSHGSISARSRGISNTSHRAERSGRSTPPPRQSEAEPMTPPMMRSSVYDSDAQPGDFDDNDFFEED